MFSRDVTYAPFQLRFSDVEFSRGQKILFSGLSFNLSPGQLLWVQGDNGIGKTSILKLALGIWTPISGEIFLTSENVPAMPQQLVTYLGHKDAFEPSLTAEESLSFWNNVYESDAILDNIIDYVGLRHQKQVRISALSAGQKRRLALARLLLSNRPIWILDEPKAAMDKTGQELIDEMLANHLGKGGGALVASHDRSLAIGKKARRLVLEANS